jgi:tRNA(Ile)-lysidine synthase
MALVAGNLDQRVGEILTRYNMLSNHAKVGVAVSGGADSVVLLHLLHRLQYNVVVLHVNHQLRGADSDEDECFVRALAAKLSVPVEVKHCPVNPGNLEQEARDGRRSFYLGSIRNLGLEKVALGHSRSDQAETVLYRFLRGSGLAGLAGMRPVTADGLIRPLLTSGRDEIRDWARAEGIPWREDASNANDAFARNRLRNETIPHLSQHFNARLESVLSENAAVAQAEEDWWHVRIESVYSRITKRAQLGLFFQTADLNLLHPAEQRRVLRRAIQEIKGDLRSIDLQHVESIRKITQSSAGHDRVLIPGVDALRSFGTLLLSRPGDVGNIPRQYQVSIELGRETALPFSLGYLYVNWVKSGGVICGNFGEEDENSLEIADLDGDVIFPGNSSYSLQARNWEPGDDMARNPGGKPEKLKSLFQDFRVLLWERRNWPVLVAGDEIVWSKAFGSAARFKANDESRNVLRLVYKT